MQTIPTPLKYICTRRDSLAVVFLLALIALRIAPVPCPLYAQSAQDNVTAADTPPKSTISRKMIVVTGAPGEEAYAPNFRNWSERWVKSCQESDVPCEWIDGTQAASESEPTTSDKKRLLEQISLAGDSELWLVLIGHGTFDGKVAKFNLRGEDISAAELSAALSSGKGTQVVVSCFSCSGAFLPELSRTGRIVITATKSGAELNYSRFGDYLSLAIQNPAADLDHDNSVSVLEAFLMGAKLTEKFYKDELRLATEHPLLDDGGDRKGVSASFFNGIRLVQKAEDGATVDGDLASMTLLKSSRDDLALTSDQIKRRDELEREIRALRQNKQSLAADDYYSKLAPIALELASLYDQVHEDQAHEDTP